MCQLTESAQRDWLDPLLGQHVTEGFCLLWAALADCLTQLCQGKAAAMEGALQGRSNLPVHSVGIDLDFLNKAAFYQELKLNAAPGELPLSAKGERKLLAVIPFAATVAPVDCLQRGASGRTSSIA